VDVVSGSRNFDMGDPPHGLFVASKHDIDLVVVVLGIAVVVLNAVAHRKPEISEANDLEDS
jgi:hypothetical protein